jgi:hypothetical protein
MKGEEKSTPAKSETFISVKKASVTLVPIRFWPGGRICLSGATIKPKIASAKK